MQGKVDALTVSKLTKRYGMSRALAGVSLTMRGGSLCALLGPNGAGKSTLLGILSTLVQPTAGEVGFQRGSETLAAGPELRRAIGVLAHDSFVYGELTGWENLLFFGRLYQLDDVEARASAMLEEVGLDRKAADRQARNYSRGMTQRLSLARALMHDPQILLFDEPFTGLDRTGASSLTATLERARGQGKIVIVVTHDLESLGGVADHVVVLRRGRLVHEQRREQAFDYAELKEIYHTHAGRSGTAPHR